MSAAVTHLGPLVSTTHTGSWLSRRGALPIRASANEVVAPLTMISPADWTDGAKAREWIVPGWVPAHETTLIAADGGIGKSTMALDLAVCRCFGARWLGLEVSMGRTVYFSAEDTTDELHRRLEAICQYRGCSLHELRDFYVVPRHGLDATLGSALGNSPIRATKLFEELLGRVVEAKAELVIIDTLADVFAGNENDRQHARQFIGLMRRLIDQSGAAVILISHPSLNGMDTGRGTSGSTAWSNSVRSRIYVEMAKAAAIGAASNVRCVTKKKTNYSTPGEQLKVEYKNGVFVPVAGLAAQDQAAADEHARGVFIELLATHRQQGLNVFPGPGKGYAPKLFASHAQNASLSAANFKKAMDQLFGSGDISVETFGPPSKRRTRLIIAPQTPTEGAAQ